MLGTCVAYIFLYLRITRIKFLFSRSQQQSVQEEIMKKFREIVREASQAVYGNKQQGGKSLYRLYNRNFNKLYVLRNDK